MKAIFFDRDGTLNIDEGGYINNPANIKLFPGALDVLKHVKKLGYKIFVITSQSGIGRGRIKPSEYRAVNARFLEVCGAGLIDDVVYCPHTPDKNCLCRKPETLLPQIVLEHNNINLRESYFIGDKISDIECGKNLGVKTILILPRDKKIKHEHENKDVKPDIIVESISEIIGIIKK